VCLGSRCVSLTHSSAPPWVRGRVARARQPPLSHAATPSGPLPSEECDQFKNVKNFYLKAEAMIWP
jgi:hypothetical protein